ncbi:MAG: hypothetical protein C0614_10600 [Desulfuromonas sp.]|nr:MAG: hypothetical protein C0614_10600 [Desulfuromonas sp.]
MLSQLTNKSLLLLIAVCSLGLLCSCSAIIEPPPGSRVEDRIGRELVANWSDRVGSFSSVQGVAHIEVDSPGSTFKGNQVLLAESPAHFRAESLSPFGVPLLTLVANKAELNVLLPAQNIFYRGRASAENLRRFTRIPLRPSALVGLLLCQTPLLNGGGFNTYAQPDGGWVLDVVDSTPPQRLYFDASGRLTAIHSFVRGYPLVMRYFDHGRLVAGFPARFELSSPRAKTVVRLDFSEQKRNLKFRPGLFQLQPPLGTTIIELDGENG